MPCYFYTDNDLSQWDAFHPKTAELLNEWGRAGRMHYEPHDHCASIEHRYKAPSQYHEPEVMRPPVNDDLVQIVGAAVRSLPTVELRVIVSMYRANRARIWAVQTHLRKVHGIRLPVGDYYEAWLKAHGILDAKLQKAPVEKFCTVIIDSADVVV